MGDGKREPIGARWWRLPAAVLAAGAVLSAGQAWGRFALLGTPSGLVFPPEALAQWLFGVIPMQLFSLGISLLGESAQWVALGAFVLLWAAAGGGVLLGVLRLWDALGARRGGRYLASGWPVAVLAAGLLLEALWIPIGQAVHVPAGPVQGMGLLPVALGYLAAGALLRRITGMRVGGAQDGRAVPAGPAGWR